ncbi:MAG: LysR family transcriptional regulator substrate-binding protein [Candidatus Eremiobacteraeota bacterium]|nr:LysR family transcriptional regulator substrate-binding protein [Candidatus Eremiobacteraeota bacterium]
MPLSSAKRPIGKRLQLTTAGREVYDRARIVIRDVDDIRSALAELEDGVSGEVGLGSIESAADFRVPRALASFLKDRPRVRVRFETGGTSALARRVASGELQLAVAAMPPAELGLTFESLYVERLALLVGTNSPLYGRRSVRLRDVASERILLTQATCSYNATLRDAASRAGVVLDVALESANVATLKRAVQLGMGAAVLPLDEMETVPEKTSVVHIEDGRLRLAIGLLRAKTPSSTVVKALANALARELSR